MLLLNYQPSWLIYAKLLDLSDIRARVQPVVTETATKPWQAPGKRPTAPLVGGGRCRRWQRLLRFSPVGVPQLLSDTRVEVLFQIAAHSPGPTARCGS